MSVDTGDAAIAITARTALRESPSRFAEALAPSARKLAHSAVKGLGRNAPARSGLARWAVWRVTELGFDDANSRSGVEGARGRALGAEKSDIRLSHACNQDGSATLAVPRTGTFHRCLLTLQHG